LSRLQLHSRRGDARRLYVEAFVEAGRLLAERPARVTCFDRAGFLAYDRAAIGTYVFRPRDGECLRRAAREIRKLESAAACPAYPPFQVEPGYPTVGRAFVNVEADCRVTVHRRDSHATFLNFRFMEQHVC
jgi:hypothetical protein